MSIVTDDMVEAGCHASEGIWRWDHFPDDVKTEKLRRMRAALEAVAPMLAGNDLHQHLLELLGAKDHEDAARIIAELHARELSSKDGAQVEPVAWVHPTSLSRLEAYRAGNADGSGHVYAFTSPGNGVDVPLYAVPPVAQAVQPAGDVAEIGGDHYWVAACNAASKRAMLSDPKAAKSLRSAMRSIISAALPHIPPVIHDSGDLPEFLRYLGDLLVSRDTLPGSFAKGIRESLRGRALIIERAAQSTGHQGEGR